MKKTFRNLFAINLFVSMVTGMFGGTVAAEDSHSILKEKSIQMKIMTYNIQHGEGMDGKLDLQRIAKQIRQSNADIIGLEEVDNHWSERSNFKDEAKELAEMLDMHYVFGANLDQPPKKGQSHNRQYGTAILSKYPILDSKNYKLTKLTDDEEQRGLLEAQVHVAGEEVWFYVTHTDHHEDPTTRARQVKDIFAITSKHNNNILVGDLNATPDAPELELLFRNFTDTWDVTQDSLGYTFPADSPNQRIDYVLTSPGIKVDSTQVIQSLASDHLPVTANVTINLGEHPFDASGIKRLVKYFEKKGIITNEHAIHSLIMHLTSVSQFEDENSPRKVVKHMNGFKTLLNQHKKNEWIPEDAYQTLKADADNLIDKSQNSDLGGPGLEEPRDTMEIAPGLSYKHIDRGHPSKDDENNELGIKIK